ncbi:response regulator [Flavobacterium sedimenticola]|uniref:Response regulator n=1 Tax=Flavobacterium sedimenticola TaxID=3043286 RepID=A0ABT6XSA9_9FLAO|nr:response regulator [Flavobacterium sedimenticola]MDI9257946.1 response regulator [Flavobacterium sedimenticola]
MRKNVIIIDDAKEQAEGLAKGLGKLLPDCSFEHYSTESEILDAIENRFFSLAILDIRMDGFSVDGIEIAEKIFEVNPFANVIIVSAFKDEYFLRLKDLILTGKVVDIQDKEEFDKWLPKLKNSIEKYYDKLDKDPSEINNALLQFYSEAKNEKETFRKGERFEHFMSLMFQSIGFNQVLKRVKDQSLNEVDLIIRNDIEDSFIGKFGKYILVECKNKPETKVNKNDFIVFQNKLKNTNGLAELGILATSGHITKNTYTEAIRESGENRKIIFLSNPEIEKLIKAENKLSIFKSLIDEQVKDN